MASIKADIKKQPERTFHHDIAQPILGHKINLRSKGQILSCNLFISHSWSYGDAYDKLSNMLRAAPRFEYKDYSVPKNDPIHDAANATKLREAISVRMGYASVVLIMAGKYATYSKWINEEINMAQKGFATKKPIIAVTPWGAQQISSTVRDAADEIVGWNSSSIVAAIRRNS